MTGQTASSPEVRGHVGIDSHDPRTGIATSTGLSQSDTGDVDRAVEAAATAFSALSAITPRQRAGWLAAIADQLVAEREKLAGLADAETARGIDRLRTEVDRAAAGLRFYGSVAAEGSWLEATIDHPAPGTADLRRMRIALGPVGVFGASNFPFAFGVLGHDSASAVAAGCPVVVKAHPAHPRLSHELGRLAIQALRTAGAPEGTYALVSGFNAGTRLVTHPATAAVAFTGSQAGGLALWRLAAQRDVVIPVFAEMGTVNPVVVTRAAAAARSREIAAGFVDSFALGTGQYCTKPGLLLVPAHSDIPTHLAAALATRQSAGWLLTQQIHESFTNGLQRLRAAGAKPLAQGTAQTSGWAAAPTIMRAQAADLEPGSALLEECFGPVAIVVEYADADELTHALRCLPGGLGAAVHGSGPDDPEVPGLVARVATTAGRVVVDGWPTGVQLGWAQQHGGPWPATSTPAATSVGAAALTRFTRPVAYQGVPESALPTALTDANPWRLPRRVDGHVQPAPTTETLEGLR